MMTNYARTTRRVARKHHRCDDCANSIHTGEVYLEHVLPPGYDILDNQTWWRMRECATCACRYGRAEAVAS